MRTVFGVIDVVRKGWDASGDVVHVLQRYFKPLIEAGYIYIAQPPLYKIQRGKDIRYAYSDAEKMAVLRDMGEDPTANIALTDDEEEEPEVDETATATTKKPGRVRIQRYKGLGEMNAEELWETTMNPEFRILKQVTIDDGQEADKIFDILMGTDVPSRKSFIQSNAKMANLDI